MLNLIIQHAKVPEQLPYYIGRVPGVVGIRCRGHRLFAYAAAVANSKAIMTIAGGPAHFKSTWNSMSESYQSEKVA